VQTEDTPARDEIRRRGRTVVVALTIVVTISLAAAVLVVRRDQRDAGDIGRLAMPTLGGGRTIALASYRGTPVVVNFFASWCLFCVAEMPEFEKAHAALGGKVAFLGVAMQDDAEAARKLAARTGVTYALVEDPTGEAFEQLGGRGMPTTLFIDAQGRVVENVTGPLSERAIRDRVAEHFSV
jgi:thiol-disulfide isomerase/thioredoxin